MEIMALVGETGSGKSSSLMNMPPNETVLINVSEKPLPFAGWQKRFFSKDREGQQKNYITKGIFDNPVTGKKEPRVMTFEDVVKYSYIISEKRPEIKYIVVDDFSHLLSEWYFSNVSIKGWDKFNDLGVDIWEFLRKTPNQLRDDLKMILMCHPEIYDSVDKVKRARIKTVGNVTDRYIGIESTMRVVLWMHENRSQENPAHRFFFDTVKDGNTAKCPGGVFNNRFIPNDLHLVLKRLEEYDTKGIVQEWGGEGEGKSAEEVNYISPAFQGI